MEHVIEAEESVKLDALRANDDGVETDTSDEQKRVEESIAKFYRMVEKKKYKNSILQIFTFIKSKATTQRTRSFPSYRSERSWIWLSIVRC